jgi:hypothetical protein
LGRVHRRYWREFIQFNACEFGEETLIRWFWASSLNSTLQHLVQLALFLKCYPHGGYTTGGLVGSDKSAEVGLHTVFLNKVISYPRVFHM